MKNVTNITLATGSPVDSLFLGDIINIIVNYGKSIDQAFKLEIDSCYLVTSTQSFGLIMNKAINQESDSSNDLRT